MTAEMDAAGNGVWLQWCLYAYHGTHTMQRHPCTEVFYLTMPGKNTVSWWLGQIFQCKDSCVSIYFVDVLES